ncbi:MAG: ABC transporter substrate-binding protein [Anaerolineaceae bacterium]
MTKTRFPLSILIIHVIIGSILAGCLPRTPAVDVIGLTDSLGRKIELAGPAQKIISMAPSNTEILFAIGASGQVIGRDSFSDYPEEAKLVEEVGGLTGSYNLEKITSLQPDLVLLAEINSVDLVDSLEKLNLKVFYLQNPKDYDGLYQNIETVGLLTGKEKEAGDLVESMQKKVKTIQTKMVDVKTPLKVYYELDGTDPTRPWTTGPGTYMDLMIQTVGGENVGMNLSSEWAQISQEEILVQNPDVILLGDGVYGVTPEMVSGRPGWSAITAVKNGRVEMFDDNLVSRPGPRMVDGLEMLARILHPDVMK